MDTYHLILAAYYVALLVSAAAAARLVSAICTDKAWQRIKARPWLHALGFTVLGVVVFMHLKMNGVIYWPDPWLESRYHRREAAKRVQAIGGWDELRVSCDALSATMGTNRQMHWDRSYPSPFPRGYTNWDNLPGVLVRLKPKQVWVERDSREASVAIIPLYGGHRTGTYRSPHFSFLVVCGTNSPDVRPKLDWTRKLKVRKVSERVWEAFD